MAKPLRRTLLAVAVAYLFAVAVIVFWPSPVDRPAAGTLNELLSRLHLHGMPKFINYNFVEFSANVAMFVPMGLFASAYFKKARVGIFVGALGSCLIELAQALLLPERFASGLDVLANTMGAGLGALIYFLLKSRRGNLQPSSLTNSYPAPEATIVPHATSGGAK